MNIFCTAPLSLIKRPKPVFRCEGSIRSTRCFRVNEKWTDPEQEGDNQNWYGMFRDISAGQSPGKWDVTFRGVGSGSIGTRIFMLDDGSSQVYLGKSPHSYRAKVYDNIYQFWRPSYPRVIKRVFKWRRSGNFTGIYLNRRLFPFGRIR